MKTLLIILLLFFNANAKAVELLPYPEIKSNSSYGSYNREEQAKFKRSISKLNCNSLKLLREKLEGRRKSRGDVDFYELKLRTLRKEIRERPCGN